MKNATWLVVGTVLMLGESAFAATEGSSQTACALKSLGSMDLTVTDKVLVPVTINDKPVFMTLNLSSATSVLQKPALDSLSISSGPWQAGTQVKFGTRAVTEVAKFHSLRLGTLVFEKGELMVDPTPEPLGQAERPIAGQLGLDVFRNVDFELDLSRRKLTLYSQDHCPGAVVYWSDTSAIVPLYRGTIGNLYLPLELDGKKIDATISPSSPFTTLSTDATKKLYGFDTRSPGVETVANEEPGKPDAHYRAMKLSAPGLTVTNSRILLAAPESDCVLRTRGGESGGAGYHDNCAGHYPMKVGRNVLEKLRMYFAMKEQKLYFTAADAPK